MTYAQPDGRTPERFRYENSEPWDKDVPADLIPAIKHLRKSFDDSHWGCGRTTEVFCYSQLHNKSVDDPRREYINYLMHMKVRVGQAATHRFHELAKEGTPPAIFKAFFDLYLEGVSVEALLVFKQLVEIGRANESRLAIPHLEWAEAQTKHLIRSNTHLIDIWVRDVCDKQIHDPNEDMEEMVFWTKWQAPSFPIMTPSLYTTYDAAAVWDRKDAESSSKLLQHFAEHYVLHLEVMLRKAVGECALELAKKPKPMESTPTAGDAIQQDLPNPAAVIPANDPYTPNNARREVRKLNTRAMHKSWQREYLKLKKSRPEMSDVWCSRQIAKMAVANGRSAQTIRKHMTQ